MTTPTLSDYLNLSANVYTTGGDTPVPPSGWTYIDSRTIASSGMQAVAYRNDTTGAIVIESKGSE